MDHHEETHDHDHAPHDHDHDHLIENNYMVDVLPADHHHDHPFLMSSLHDDHDQLHHDLPMEIAQNYESSCSSSMVNALHLLIPDNINGLMFSNVPATAGFPSAAAIDQINQQLIGGSFLSNTDDHHHHGAVDDHQNDCVKFMIQQSGMRMQGINRIRNKVSRRVVRTRRVAFQTRSTEDVLDDGYRWRKYGQKAVKNSVHPRSYYRCTHHTCNVKKQIQRLAKDTTIVVTTYEGLHNHPSEKLMETLTPLLKQLHFLSTF